MQAQWKPFPRAEVIKAIERRFPSRIPLVRVKWWGEGLVEQEGDRLRELDRFPEDAVVLLLNPLDYSKMGLSWPISEEGAHNARVILDDWAKLDEFIARLPDPQQDPQFDAMRTEAASVRASGPG